MSLIHKHGEKHQSKQINHWSCRSSVWEFNSPMGDFGVCKSIVKDVRMCGYRSSDSRVLFMNKVRDFESYLKIKRN